MKNFNIVKLSSIAVGAVLALSLALNSYTIVPSGHVKVASLFGKVDVTDVKTEGFHMVNPLMSFDTFSIRNDKYEMDGLNIPTQDRFNSTGNITVIYSIDAAKAAEIRINYGTVKQFIDKTLRQHLRSIIRDEGRKQADSRSLAVSANVSAMQENTRTRLIEKLGDTGIIVDEVLIQDIQFDPRIAQQILQTQQRIQKEEQEKSQLRIAKTQAAKDAMVAQGKADANIQQARGAAESRMLQATAERDAAIAKAEGTAQSITLVAKAEADANRKIAASLTAMLIRKQELDNEAVLFSKSKGNVPHTVIGKTDLRAYGMPLAVQ